MPAIQAYRETFRPSEQLAKSHLMLGFNVYAAATDAEGQRLATSHRQAFLNLRYGRPGRLPPPVDDLDSQLTEDSRSMLERFMICSAIGSPDTVRQGLAAFIERTGADELMITGQIFDHAARLRSFEIVAEIRESL